VQTSGPRVSLSDPNAKQLTFTAPDVDAEGDSLTVELTVTDHNGFQSADSCVVNVTWLNEPPQANAGLDQTVTEGTVVTLDGSVSTDSDDGIASHLWTQVEGDPVSISDPTSAVMIFTAPKADLNGKNLKFKLTVKDFGGLQGTADGSVYVRQNELPNNPPAAAFSVALSRKVALFTDNSSDTDGGIVSWLWNFADGQTSTEQNPEHRYNKFGNYSVTLTVTDDRGLSNSISKNVTIEK
jgi:PKD repeat protein